MLTFSTIGRGPGQSETLISFNGNTYNTYDTYYAYKTYEGKGVCKIGRMKTFASTDWAKNRAKDKYRRAHYRNVCIVMKEAERDALRAAAANVNESISTYAKKAIADRMATGK